MDNQFSITRSSEIRLFAVLFFALAFILVGSFIFSTKVNRGDSSVPTETASTFFPPDAIEAKAAYVYDVRTKTVLFAKNENTRLPLASLTKVMSALVALDTSPSYGTITITLNALKAEGDSGLLVDEKWSLGRLLDFSLTTSSNDGMRAVALSLGALSRADATSEEIINDFVGEMNLKASELGLQNTYFWNETGLDESDFKGGAYGTARDMSMLVEYVLAYHPELFIATRESLSTLQSIDNYPHVAKNTNIIANEIPKLLASKTGFTNTAGGNLIIAFDPELGRPIIISILGSTEKGRFEDARALIASVMEYIKEN
jgi:serine-type D-Ala-D-Ala carboxypeptidase (penicillin-binding protein 5/6)